MYFRDRTIDRLIQDPRWNKSLKAAVTVLITCHSISINTDLIPKLMEDPRNSIITAAQRVNNEHIIDTTAVAFFGSAIVDYLLGFSPIYNPSVAPSIISLYRIFQAGGGWKDFDISQIPYGDIQAVSLGWLIYLVKCNISKKLLQRELEDIIDTYIRSSDDALEEILWTINMNISYAYIELEMKQSRTFKHYDNGTYRRYVYVKRLLALKLAETTFEPQTTI